VSIFFNGITLDSNKYTPTVATRARPLRRGSRTPSHDKRSANVKVEILLEAFFLDLKSKRDKDYDGDHAKEQSITIRVEYVS